MKRVTSTLGGPGAAVIGRGGRARAAVGARGRRSRGCGAPARVVAVSRTHRPRIGRAAAARRRGDRRRRGDPRAARRLAAPVPPRSAHLRLGRGRGAAGVRATRAWSRAGCRWSRRAASPRARCWPRRRPRSPRPGRAAMSSWRSVAARASGCARAPGACSPPRRGTAARRCAGDAVIVSPGEPPRLDTWPFAPSPISARRDGGRPAPGVLGRRCAVLGRLPPRRGAPGWPLRPFHRQHPLRAGLNERRPANMHEGVDIQAQDGTRVYAMQSGTARVLKAGTVGRARRGRQLPLLACPSPRAERASSSAPTPRSSGPSSTAPVICTCPSSRASASSIRCGRAAACWRRGPTRRAPVIGAPDAEVAAGASTVEVFDPQSFRAQIKYRTPVARSGGARLPRLGRRRARRDRASLRAARRRSTCPTPRAGWSTPPTPTSPAGRASTRAWRASRAGTTGSRAVWRRRCRPRRGASASTPGTGPGTRRSATWRCS